MLADSAEEPAEVDVAAAERDWAQAQEELKTAGRENLDEVRLKLELAQARLDVARRK